MLLPASSLACRSGGPLLRNSLFKFLLKGSRAQAGVVVLAGRRRLSNAGNSGSNSSSNSHNSSLTNGERLSDSIACPGGGLADTTAAVKRECSTTPRRRGRLKKQLDCDAASPQNSGTTAEAGSADKPTFSTQVHATASAAVSADSTSHAAAATVQAPANQHQQSMAETKSAADTAIHAPSAVTANSAGGASLAGQYDATVGATICDVLELPTDSAPQFQNAAYTLRDYQQEAIRSVLHHWKEEKVGVQLVMLPTGCGKTVVFAALARYMSQHYIPGLNLVPLEDETAPLVATESLVATAELPENRPDGRAMSASMPVVGGAAAGGAVAEVEDVTALRIISTENSTPTSPAAADGSLTAALDESSAHEAAAAAATAPALEQPLNDASTAAAATAAAASDGGAAPPRTFRSWRMKHSQAIQEGAAAAPTSAGMFEEGAAAAPTPAGMFEAADAADAADAASSTASSAAANHESPLTAEASCTAAADGTCERYTTSTDSTAAELAMPGSKCSSSSGTTTSTTATDDDNDSAPRGSSSSRRRRDRPRKVKGGQGSGSATASLSSAPSSADQFRVLVLAHRFELLHQAEDKFILVWPGCTISWVKAGRKEFHGQVVVASVGTAVNCVPQLQACRFNLVIVDEAHHSVANTYKAVLKGLGFLREELVPAPVNPSTSNDSSSSSVSLHSSLEEEQAGFAGVVAAAATATEPEQQPQEQEAATAVAAAEEWDRDMFLSDNASRSSRSRNGSSEISKANSSAGQAKEQLVPVLTAVHKRNSLCVGFTATPYRMKKAESEELYDIFRIAYMKNISDMIRAGYLSKIHSRKVLTQVDLKSVSSTSGDFVVSQLSSVVNSPSRNKLVLAGFLDFCTKSDPAAVAAQTASSSSSTDSDDDGEGSSDSDRDSSVGAKPETPLTMAGKTAARKALGFAVDIAHASALDEIFRSAGVRSGVVHSKLTQDEVQSRIREFRKGELDILWNCEKLTEGFDEPSISAVLMARPTKSQGLYVQMLGRGLRLAPGKDACLVLDFTDKYHKADSIIDLRVILPEGDFKALDKKAPPEERDTTSKLDISKFDRGGEMSVLGEDAKPLDYAWKPVGQHWMLNLFKNGTLWLVNMADMGPKQRQQLSLVEATSQQQQQQQQDTDIEDGSSEDQDDSGYDLQDRYVVLHQPSSKMVDPLQWDNVAPQAKTGMTQADAYGVAVDRMYAIIHQCQAAAVSSKNEKSSGKAGWRSGYVPTAGTFRRDAKWRLQPASDSQLNTLRKLGVELPRGLLTKGHASDLISASLAPLATPQQLAQLQDTLLPAELADLPTPLLRQRAAQLLAAE